MFISYAQNFEDVMLWRALGDVKNGNYIDIGAFDPYHDSVSHAFYERGWRGVHAEPVPECAAKIQASRPDEIVIAAAIGDGDGKVDLHKFTDTGMTTAVADYAEEHKKNGWKSSLISVEQVPLSRVFEELKGREIHWMKVDVEGMEHSVLRSWKKSAARPWIVVVESVLPNSANEVHQEWESELSSRGYKSVYFDGLNRFYLHESHSELAEKFTVGPNFHDAFAVSEAAPVGAELARRLSDLKVESDQRLAQASEEVSRLERSLADQAAGIAEGVRQAVESVSQQAREARIDHDALVKSLRRELREIKAAKAAEQSQQAALREKSAARIESARSEAYEAGIELGQRRVDKAREAEQVKAQFLGEKLRAEILSLEVELSGQKRAHAAAQLELAAAREQAIGLAAALDAERVQGVERGGRIAQLELALHEKALSNLELEPKCRDLEGRVAVLQGSLNETQCLLEATQAEAQGAHGRGAMLQARVDQLEIDLSAVTSSMSWRLTAPFRRLAGAVRGSNSPSNGAVIANGVRSWLTFRPTSRPRRILRGVIAWVTFKPSSRPRRILARLLPTSQLPSANGAIEAPDQSPEVSPSVEVAAGQDLTVAVTAEVPSFQDGATYVYVDHTIGCPVNTGMQRAVRGLTAGLEALGSSLVFVKWSRASKKLVLINQDELAHLAKWNGPKRKPQWYPAAAAAEIEIDPRDGAIDWLIIPEVTYINYAADEPTLDVIMAAKEAKLRTAAIFYDAIPAVRSEFATISRPHEAYMRALLLVDYIAPISEWSAKDLVSYFRFSEHATLDTGPKIEPLLLPFSSPIEGASGPRLKSSEKLILSVGTIEQRKNQVTLLRAFEAFMDRHPDSGWRLELVGSIHDAVKPEVLQAADRCGAIRVSQGHSDEALKELYDTCAFTVFPSVEEGYGLPIAESLSHGKPCICANFGAMAEVAASGGCHMVDTHSADEISKAIERLVFDSDYRDQLASEAGSREKTTWLGYAGEFANRIALEASAESKVRRIYYFVDHTTEWGGNTGIQRVVRGLAKTLSEFDVELIPVKWSMPDNDFTGTSAEQLDHLGRWNGPDVEVWSDFDQFETVRPGDWLVIPELISSPEGPKILDIHRRARERDLRIAWVFYDAIPWKMRDLYPTHTSEAHGAYMRNMATADLVFGISEHSTNDLIEFLRASPDRIPYLHNRVVAVPLPGELQKTPRIDDPRLDTGGPVRILSVGTIEPRKNHLTLLRAFELMRAKISPDVEVELTLVGIAPYPDLAAQVDEFLARNTSIRWLQSVDDQQLSELYREATFTVYPSLEEGFGLPILESLWKARPCVCHQDGAMAEVAVGGGCVLADMASPDAVAEVMESLVLNPGRVQSLADAAVTRDFKTWSDYGSDVLELLADERHIPVSRTSVKPVPKEAFGARFCNVADRPLLSICISTFNRADWLALSLKNIFSMMPEVNPDIEILVCDNTSVDHTPEVVVPYLSRKDFSYHRNPENVGMLGNLRVTAHHARGEYVWILGDDDLVAPGGIENVMKAIADNRDAALIYLNYNFTREEDALNVTDLDHFFSTAESLVEATPDQAASIAEISTLSRNFFTAIYCLVYRRDHALFAYSQDTSGEPFSTMLTCIPTTNHVMHRMMHEKGVWLGTPQLVVNMNVSWMKYAPLWILERIPEAIDLAEKMGASMSGIDHCRSQHLPELFHWFYEILKDDQEENRRHFDPARVLSRFAYLPEFAEGSGGILDAYEKARSQNPEAFPMSREAILPSSPYTFARLDEQ